MQAWAGSQPASKTHALWIQARSNFFLEWRFQHFFYFNLQRRSRYGASAVPQKRGSLRKAKLAVVPPRACTGYVQGMCMCRLGLESASLTSLPPSPSPLLKPHHHVPLPHRARLQTLITLDYNGNLDYTVIWIIVISITRLPSIT